MIRSSWPNGPRSVTRTRTDAPVSTRFTSSQVPNGRKRWAAVSSFGFKAVAARRPSSREPCAVPGRVAYLDLSARRGFGRGAGEFTAWLSRAGLLPVGARGEERDGQRRGARETNESRGAAPAGQHRRGPCAQPFKGRGQVLCLNIEGVIRPGLESRVQARHLRERRSVHLGAERVGDRVADHGETRAGMRPATQI